jgi:phosphohistidine phosphatase SixA
MKTVLFSLILGSALVAANEGVAQERVFIIRHADKAATGEDPSITDHGRLRAANWARVLAHAGVEAVFTSTATRARQTGDIIAETLGLPAEAVAPGDTVGLIDLLAFDYEDQRVLIVGHTETIPSLLDGFGVSSEWTVGANEYDALFVVTPASGDGLRLKVPFSADQP